MATALLIDSTAHFHISIFTIMELSKEEKRELIWYFWKKRKTGSQILKELVETLGEECQSNHMVYKWIDRFESGWDDFDDAPHGARPKSSKTWTNI